MASSPPQLRKGVFRQAQLAATHDGQIVHHIQRGQNAAPVGAHLDLGQRLKTLGTVDGTAPVQVGDISMPGIDGHAAQGQLGDRRHGLLPFGANGTTEAFTNVTVLACPRGYTGIRPLQRRNP